MALTTYSVSITSGAAHTKGAYTQVVAATPYASSRLHLDLDRTGVANRQLLVDLATGAAGAETVVVANLAVLTDPDALAGAYVALDVDIPAGTRLALRCQAVTAATSLAVNLYLEDRALGGLAAPVTYGTADLANTRATQIDPGGTANTKGSYVELTTSTSARLDALAICCTTDFQGTAIATLTTWFLDVATGAAGAETVVVPNLAWAAGVTADVVRPGIVRVPVVIPAGTRLAVRCQCSVATAVQRVLRVTLIGMQEPATSGGGSAAGAVAYVG